MSIRYVSIAREIQRLSYDDMMALARTFSSWTGDGPDSLSRIQMAVLLFNWAAAILSEAEGT